MPIGVELLFDSSGIELADKLSIEYIQQGLDCLRSMRHIDNKPIIDIDEKHCKALVGLALKVKTRKY